MTTTGRRLSMLSNRSQDFKNTMEMACDAEDCEFQMLNDDEIVTFVQEESDPVDDETDEDVDSTTTKVARVHQMLTCFLR
ncbi:uncharacterized protein TNCV_4738291 [Trichonephila clavipes]|nr:uncharacterized protein TNCV_4738291 [Trichonephila clavipes]